MVESPLLISRQRILPDPQFEYLLGGQIIQRSKVIDSEQCRECKQLREELQIQKNLLQHVFQPDAKKRIEEEIDKITEEIAQKGCNSLNCQPVFPPKSILCVPA